MTPINDWVECKNLLLARLNKASHGRIVSKDEIIKLKESCEKALSHFLCDNCNEYIFYAKHNSNLQCQCGKFKWNA